MLSAGSLLLGIPVILTETMGTGYVRTPCNVNHSAGIHRSSVMTSGYENGSFHLPMIDLS